VCIVVLLAVFAQPGKEVPKLPKPTPSLLGADDTAFPELKLPAPPRDGQNYERYRKEREELFAKLLKDVPAPPKELTLLQKVQYEQLQAGRTAIRKIEESIEIGRWDSAYFKEYISLLGEVDKLAAELQPTLAARIKYYEVRVLRFKEFERFMSIRVDLGNDAPHVLHVSRFARLQAEADLLKLKELLNPSIPATPAICGPAIIRALRPVWSRPPTRMLRR
jgi:hypothetical protein